jgi:hypothetical protein
MCCCISTEARSQATERAMSVTGSDRDPTLIRCRSDIDPCAYLTSNCSYMHGLRPSSDPFGNVAAATQACIKKAEQQTYVYSVRRSPEIVTGANTVCSRGLLPRQHERRLSPNGSPSPERSKAHTQTEPAPVHTPTPSVHKRMHDTFDGCPWMRCMHVMLCDTSVVNPGGDRAPQSATATTALRTVDTT